MRDRDVVWVDGALQPAETAVADARDSAYASGLGCYTTARWSGGRARFAAAHAARIARDAHALGLGALDPAFAQRAFTELGHAAFGAHDGVLRLQASRDGGGRLRLVGVTRPLGAEPATWRAARAPLPHPGPQGFAGVKLTGVAFYAHAREAARARGAQDALLFDAAGRLVEGARTNAFVVLADGDVVTPPLARGAVDGVARAIALAAWPEIVERDVDARSLAGARELVLVNAVRGARPVVALDGLPIHDARPGPWSARLRAALADDAEPGC